MKKLFVLLFLFSTCQASEFKTFNIDFYGNYCKGGLFHNSKEGLKRQAVMLMNNGPRLSSEQQKKKARAILIRVLELKNEVN